MKNSLTILGAAAIIALGLYFGLRERSAPTSAPAEQAGGVAPQSSGPTPAEARQPGASASNQRYQPKHLEVGQPAYVRVKEISTSSRDDSGPKGDAITLSFGEEVTLVKKHENVNTWLVSKDDKQGWIYSLYLTANKDEIDFLQTIARIPTTMSLIYNEEDGIIRIQGFLIRDMGGLLLTIESESLALATTDKVASVGNAVMFDSSVTDITSPILPIGCGDKSFATRPDAMYYCTSVDSQGNGCFECLDLRTLSTCED